MGVVIAEVLINDEVIYTRTCMTFLEAETALDTFIKSLSPDRREICYRRINGKPKSI